MLIGMLPAVRRLAGTRRTRRRYILLACWVCASLLWPLTSGRVARAADQYDLWSNQLANLVSQRTSLLTTLARDDREVGATVARDAFAALRPVVALQTAAIHATTARVNAGLRMRLPETASDRDAGPGLLLGAHLPLATATPFTATPGSPSAWSSAVLGSVSLALAHGPTSAVLTTRGAAGYLAPDSAAVSSTAEQPVFAPLGAAQDLAPLHALAIGGSALPLQVVAPQARPAAAPPAYSPAPPNRPPPVQGRALLRLAAVSARGVQTALARIVVPSTLPAGGLDPNARLTAVAQVQSLLGHYRLDASSGAASTVIGTGFLASQVTWTMSATTPMTTTGATELDAAGHADGGSLHDLTLRAASLPAGPLGQAHAPGTRADLTLLPTGSVQVRMVTVLTDTTTITTTAQIDGVGADPALENALAGENLTMTELTGVLSAGNAVYARLHPLYLTLEAQYTQQLAAVMAANAAGEQAWWDRFSAWHTYQLALAKWKQRTAAWNAYLARRLAVPATATLTPAPSLAADPGPSPGVLQSTTLHAPIAARPPGMAEPPQVAITPIFGVVVSPTPTAPSASDVGTLTATPVPSDTPSPTDSPVGVSATPTAQGPEASATGTAVATAPSAFSPAATATDSATVTATATVPLTATVAPSTTATDSPSPSPSPSASPVPTATPTAPPQPGPPPTPVPQPGLEPAFQPLPPPIPPLPPWVDAAPVVSPPVLNGSFSQGINALGYATMSTQQLLAGGALDNIGSIAAPLQGVITTFWGGSTPWQSFHPGLDIAAPLDTPIRAAADGFVVYAGLAVPGDPTVSYGNCVLILHNNHLSTLYGHMDLGLHGLAVRPGEVVHQGQIIGYEGSTGWATGPHLHFELRYNNVQFDPLLLISQQAITG